MSRLFPNSKTAADIAAQEMREEDRSQRRWPEMEYIYLGNGDYEARVLPQPRFLLVRRVLFQGVYEIRNR